MHLISEHIFYSKCSFGFKETKLDAVNLKYLFVPLPGSSIFTTLCTLNVVVHSILFSIFSLFSIQLLFLPFHNHIISFLTLHALSFSTYFSVTMESNFPGFKDMFISQTRLVVFQSSILLHWKTTTTSQKLQSS